MAATPPFLLLVAGGLVFAALLHVATAIRRPVPTRPLLLAGACMAGLAWAFAGRLTGSGGDSIASSLATMPPLFACLLCFFATYDTRPRPVLVRGLLAVAAVLTLMGIASLAASPSVVAGGTVTMPDGHRIAVPGWALTPGFHVAGLWAWVVMGYGLAVTFGRWRRTGGAGALTLWLATALFFASAVQGLAVRMGWLDMPHLGLAGLGLVVLAISAAFMRDEQDRRRTADARLRMLAFVDPLTGLASRARLLEALDERPRDRAHALLRVDLDDFRSINNALGAPAGDALLQAVAARFAPLAGDGVLARLGGDDFALLAPLHAATGTDARRLVGRVRQALAEPFVIDGRRLGLRASIGVALCADPAEPPFDILRRAELALDQARHQGRGDHAVHHPALDSLAERHLQLAEGVRAALQAGQLSLCFQPKTDAAGRPRGAEALLRWTHPLLGEVSPLEFVEVAEQRGLIADVGRWVLESACRQLAAWDAQAGGLVEGIAVNVSTSQLLRAEFVAEVDQAVRDAGIAPSRLTLEITETTALADPEVSHATLRTLRSLGVRIALDDFGTGYSSLAQLRDLPVDELKIDRSFVLGLGVAGGDAIVGPILSMGRLLALDVVAEGVETREQRDTLAAMGCRMFQGFLFARPMPPQDAFDWMRAQAMAGTRAIEEAL